MENGKRRQTCQPSRFWRDSLTFLPDVPRPAKSWKCPAFCTKSVFFARAQFVTLLRCPDVRPNANHPIESNYGNSVRFLAKIPNGTAAETSCYSVFCAQLISEGCIGPTSKKISMWVLPTVPLFAGKSGIFTRNVPRKTFSRLAGLRRRGRTVIHLTVATSQNGWAKVGPYDRNYAGLARSLSLY